jgi:DNA-binding response OmpR family regulator
MRNPSVHIAQHDSERAVWLTRLFEDAGFTCHALTAHHAGVAILDDPQPLDVCARIRMEAPDTGIVFVSSDGAMATKLNAFRAGADDYVTWPCDPDELLLRVQALVRRTQAYTIAGPQCRIGRSIVDLSSGKAMRDDQPVTLTARAVELLRYLYAHREEVVPQSTLLRDVWGYSSTNTRTIDAHMAMLRHHLERDPSRPEHLITFKKRGCMFTEIPFRRRLQTA